MRTTVTTEMTATKMTVMVIATKMTATKMTVMMTATRTTALRMMGTRATERFVD
jgi:hypothetical protein